MPSAAVRHPVFARFYGRLSSGMERGGVSEQRHKLLAGLAGSVLEVGAGNGLNFGHYPAAVTAVLAVEPEPHLRALAEQSALRATTDITVTDAVAEHLPAGDQEFDAVVATLMLCSVSDPALVLREMRRVLRSAGELRFMEHVAADSAGLRRIQRIADATCWPACFGGCHASRDPLTAIAAAGFRVRELENYRLPDTWFPWPTVPHARGIAVRA
jgi:ubiquinone/menaquinone biosynthesis C-methylase UbiE